MWRDSHDVVAREDAGRSFISFVFKNVPFSFCDLRFNSRDHVGRAMSREHFHARMTLVIFVILSPWLHPWELAGRALVSRDSIVSWQSASFVEVGTPSISVIVHSIASLIKPSRRGDRVAPITPLCRNKARPEFTLSGRTQNRGERFSCVCVLIFSSRDHVVRTSDLRGILPFVYRADFYDLQSEILQTNIRDAKSTHGIMPKLGCLFSLRVAESKPVR